MTVARLLTNRICRTEDRAAKRDRSCDGQTPATGNPAIEGVIFTTPDGEGYILYSQITAA